MSMLTCSNPACGKPHKNKRPHGWCDGCYLRWLRAGRPEGGPPEPSARHQYPVTSARLEATRAGMRAKYEGRLARFRALADRGMPNSAIAEHMKVDIRTIHRYRTVYKPLRLPYEDRLAEFREMAAASIPVKQIALALNVRPSTVRGYRRTARKRGWL